LSARVGDEIMMMSAEKGNYLGLSEVGARIWELIETPRDTESLCETLQAEFEVDGDTCRADVGAFVAEMEKHGAIAVDQP
jgi:hypothetical protein